jgi:hypothetical protein
MRSLSSVDFSWQIKVYIKKFALAAVSKQNLAQNKIRNKIDLKQPYHKSHNPIIYAEKPTPIKNLYLV